MRIIEPSFKIETAIDGTAILKQIELFARNCYKSEGKTTETSHLDFVKKLMHTFKHEGICDHHIISVRWICCRGVSHELVRHRLAAYLQESQRYVNYSGKGVEFIRSMKVRKIDNWLEYMGFEQPGDIVLTPAEMAWYWAMYDAEKHYNILISDGWKPEDARDVLPNATKTEVISSMNLTSWRNFFKKRTATQAHPKMRQLTIPMLAEFKKLVPVIFDDIEPGAKPVDVMEAGNEPIAA